MASIDVTTLPFQLRWQDVDPAVWVVDVKVLRSRALELAADALMDTPLSVAPRASAGTGKGKAKAPKKKASSSSSDEWKAAAEQNIALAFGRAFGPWAGGWRWARDEGSFGGGVISSWCCASHSVSANIDVTGGR